MKENYIKYTGEVTILAKECNRKAAESILNTHICFDKDNNTDSFGFIVQTGDKFIWIDKETFDSIYHVSETFTDRMVFEYTENFERLLRLIKFIKDDKFKSLSAEERMRLVTQSEIMRGLIKILGDRISYELSKQK